jgi:putative transposase
MRTAYKCRAYPTQEQAALLSRTFGCIRFVWNHTLDERHRLWHQERKGLSYKESDANLTALKRKPEFEWLTEVAAVPLQQAIRHQYAAMQAFFQKRAKYPRFKTRNSRQSATFTRAGMSMRDGTLRIAKASEPLRFVWSWNDVDVTGLDPTSVTISWDTAGRWFVSFAVEVADPSVQEPTGQRVGIDVGLTSLTTLSTGEKIAHPKHMDQHERRLKRYQRMMARRRPKPGQESSNRYKKAKLHAAKQHAKVADARRDHLHKLTTELVRKHDLIAIEDLNVSGMVKNRCLSKAISRTGWYEMRRQLEYKTERYGRQVITCDRWYPSSKTCSDCGHLLAKLSLGTRHWTCPGCGTLHDRDVNAAKNILVAAGLVETQNARGADVRATEATPGRSAAKREPIGSRSA